MHPIVLYKASVEPKVLIVSFHYSVLMGFLCLSVVDMDMPERLVCYDECNMWIEFEIQIFANITYNPNVLQAR